MKKYIVFAGCLLIFSGCTTMEVQPTIEPLPYSRDSQSAGTLSNMKHVHVGMTYEEVRSIMGSSLKVGYIKNDRFLGGFEPITLKNPYKAEIVGSKDNLYNVMYYYSDVVNPDGIISEEELTPLVFKNNTLVGKGPDYLFKLKQEIKS